MHAYMWWLTCLRVVWWHTRGKRARFGAMRPPTHRKNPFPTHIKYMAKLVSSEIEGPIGKPPVSTGTS